MKILITGGLGFIGEHLTKALVSEGHQVSIVDNFIPDIHGLEITSVVKLYNGSFLDEVLLKSALVNIDVVIHLASSTIPNGARSDPVDDIAQNIIGTVKLLQAMHSASVNKIIFSSSGGTVYGEAEYIPIDELHKTEPLNSYGVCKLTAEKYIQMLSRNYGITHNILRISNPYGPRRLINPKQGLINVVLDKLVNSGIVTIFGDGSAVRDYIFIDDLIVAISILLIKYSI